MEYDSLDDFAVRAGYTIHGIWYPRVTAIVNIKAKPALLRYYGGMKSYKAADKAKTLSAHEGTLVHEAVASFSAGTDATVIPPSIQPSLDAYIEFLRNNDVEPLAIEKRVISKRHHYAGTIDMVARVNGTVGVLDLKTGKSIYREYGIQTAAYLEALNEESSLPVATTSWILRLDQLRECQLCGVTLRTKGGLLRISSGGRGCKHQWSEMKGQFEFQEIHQSGKNFEAFLAAQKLWRWEHDELLELLSQRLQVAASV